MIRTLALLAIIACVPAVFGGGLWNAGLHKKFAMFGGFNPLAMTVAEAVKKEYTKAENPETSSFGELDLYLPKPEDKCTSDSVIGLYFDENEIIAGLRIFLPKNEIKPHFDMKQQGYTSWTHNSVEYWSISMFFVSQDKQTRRNAVNPNRFEVIRDKNVTVSGVNGVISKIPASVDDIKADPDWEKEACVILMGQHYYYKMTPELACDTAFHSFFPLYDNNTKQLIGMGLMLLGKCNCDLESPDINAVKMIVPTAPQCLYDLVESVGVCTLHMYFVDHPRLISC